MNVHDRSGLVADPLSPHDIERLDRSTNLAEGLPGWAYYDPSFYEAERKHVFAAGWVGVGFRQRYPQP
ncbi:hypothetical protein [Mesorhizobium sp. M0091]|uniref:hypothetical protein n=1 Tax=Mesorhizobium sp. M0091 TaxID=2956875 RepID=UPI00333A0ABE